MVDNQLILAAADSSGIPLQSNGGLTSLIHSLQNCGFIGEKTSALANQTLTGQVYRTGNRIMDHISLVGCSPVYCLSPDSEEPSGYITVSPVYNEQQFIYGINTMTPKCLTCRQAIADWSQSLPGPLMICSVSEYKIECTECGQVNQLDSFRFRREAVVVRFFIFIEGIYPREAVPMEGLLATLEQHVGSSVGYYYCQGDQ